MTDAVTTPPKVMLTASSFRYEADLVNALAPVVAHSVFRRGDPDVFTFREVPAARGVPDLVMVRFDPLALEGRAAYAVQPLSSDREVRIVQFLRRSGSLDRGELARATGLPLEYLRRSALPMLEQLGWVQMHANDVALRSGTQPVGRRVVTVEAKLRDWFRAFNQARDQFHSADAAYIALDESAGGRMQNQVEAIAQRGVGVILVNADTNNHRVIARPHRVLPRRATAVGRELLAERSHALWVRGERSGQVSPVFGWFPPTSSPND
ncbi:hypothetical protein [Rathayibacter agropyri]|uniref:hypothetical protein n=1 Tax=Rathayibacter agropyri TaxID=1634927 RepID=UPI0015653775|nr:hypothetical protein [Rathayibacter agropyri]NRD10088.1 hypothetical protein [Rathayibacter agropyri]